MVSIIPILLQGAGLGFSASVSPGPLLAYLVSQSLTSGWKRGAIVAVAPLVSDIPLIIAILLLLKQVPALFVSLISLVGGIYVIYLAFKLFQSWRSKPGEKTSGAASMPHNLARAVLVNYSSPGPYLFWTLVNGPLLLAAMKISIWHGILFMLSFYIFFIGSMLILAGIFSQARRLGSRIIRVLSIISIAILCIFGGLLIYRGFSAL